MEQDTYTETFRRKPVEGNFRVETFEVMQEASFVINSIMQNPNHVKLVELEPDEYTRIDSDDYVRVQILGDYLIDNRTCLSGFWRAVRGIEAYNNAALASEL